MIVKTILSCMRSARTLLSCFLFLLPIGLVALADSYSVPDRSYTVVGDVDLSSTFFGWLRTGPYDGVKQTVFTITPTYTSTVDVRFSVTKYSASTSATIPWGVEIRTMTGIKSMLDVAAGGSGSVRLKKGEIYKFTIYSDYIIRFAEYEFAFTLKLVPDTPPPAPASLSISPTSASKGAAAGTGSISVSANTSWTASASDSWITITSGQSGSGNGTISYAYSANSSSSGRTGYVYVGYSSGEERFTLTQSGYVAPVKPDLRPYAPSGWSAPLVVTTSPSSTTSSSFFLDTDTIYVRRAVICSGKSVGAFKTALYVDGVKRKTFATDSLEAGYYKHHASGVSIGTLPAGTHVIKIVVDDDSEISESDEGNNVYTVTIAVSAAAPPSTYLVRFYQNIPINPEKAGAREDVYEQSFARGVFQGLALMDSQIGWSSPSGKAFLGWAKSRTATAATYADGERVKDLGVPGEIVELYAVWGVSSAPYTICFAANGGTGRMPDQVCAANEVVKLGACTFASPDHRHFAGWACSNGRRYDDGMLVFNLAEPGETVTMTAIWE